MNDGRHERTVPCWDERGVDLVSLSHLRWSFVRQRPQHLLSRCARTRRVFFFEEPVFDGGPVRLQLSTPEAGVKVAVPHLPYFRTELETTAAQRRLLDEMFNEYAIGTHALWYFTPMALAFTRHLAPAAIVYDCMDELSAFRGAPPALAEWETELLRRTDVVLTGGQSLYEAKRGRHPNVHALPSSVDVAHFARARGSVAPPRDQANIPSPRLGFFGVIDERMDLDLIAMVARARTDWHVVLVGPVAKIDESVLPRLPNIHYLGLKSYQELPLYLAGWEVALLPFARNEATRFISPTKTPEYLAAGKPVVSTSIRDVVKPYGALGFVRIANTPSDFIRAIDLCLTEERSDKLVQIDRFLGEMSWDRTWARAESLLEAAITSGRSTRKVNSCSIT